MRKEQSGHAWSLAFVILLSLLGAVLLTGCSGLHVEWDARATYRNAEALEAASRTQDAAISRALEARFVERAVQGLR